MAMGVLVANFYGGRKSMKVRNRRSSRRTTGSRHTTRSSGECWYTELALPLTVTVEALFEGGAPYIYMRYITLSKSGLYATMQRHYEQRKGTQNDYRDGRQARR